MFVGTVGHHLFVGKSGHLSWERLEKASRTGDSSAGA